MTDFFKVLIGEENVEVIEFYKGKLSRRELTNEEKLRINLNSKYEVEVEQLSLDDLSLRISSDPTNFYRLLSVNIDGYDYDFKEMDGHPTIIPLELVRNFGNLHIFQYTKYPLS